MHISICGGNLSAQNSKFNLWYQCQFIIFRNFSLRLWLTSHRSLVKCNLMFILELGYHVIYLGRQVVIKHQTLSSSQFFLWTLDWLMKFWWNSELLIYDWYLIYLYRYKSCLNYFGSISHSSTPCKRQKSRAFLTFSGGIEMDHWSEVD